ncbi:tetratricopeptide repeat protein [Fibrivirga algicola]|uniref:Phospholipid carrier-dependent glycosyltransferase n=1 Tax=Fibrivirga algicola TaxID=2950420 RepID=A0ABX0QCQ9_9BACT|nr:hypothetical protein [Fibrivirga algicola]NID09036.1 hypothetical protein [Fibrivirga algicola]
MSLVLPQGEVITSPTYLSAGRKQRVFWLIMLALLAAGIVRSNWATRLDSFTLDEAYHIMAGVSYAKTGSYRINPEHPPLTKRWVGTVVLMNGYNLAPFRPLQDKVDERRFAEEGVYLKNDPDAIQQQARAAMFALNSLLLLGFTLLLRRVLGPVVALATLAYLVIDPTVAAHLPVVMTDLPVALLSGTSMLAAVVAFRSWRVADLALLSLCVGVTLASKHSAVLTVMAVALLGGVLALAGRGTLADRLRRLGLVALVLVGALVVLWGFYGFRYRDSVEVGEFFNRPLATKIDDIRSPLYKDVLHRLADWQLLPASYLWGLADTIRAGVEGRANSAFAFGKLYYSRAPFYYTPGIWAVKLPLGLLLLTLGGLGLWLLKRLPQAARLPLAALALLAGFFWLALAKGSTYGGVRHALSVLPLLAVLGGLVVAAAIDSQSRWLRGGVLVALAAALLLAGPVVRPWEYFNELVGGPATSYRYFNDEGVDLNQRSKELVEYYKTHIQPSGQVPFIWYGVPRSEKQRYQLHWVGEKPEQDSLLFQSEHLTGTVLTSTQALAPNLYQDDYLVFQKAKPVARMGNLLVFQGTFRLPNLRASWLGGQGYKALYIDAKPNPEKAIRYIAEAVRLNPKIFVIDLELGNLYAQRGDRQKALHAFGLAHRYCPDDDMKKLLAQHLVLLRKAETGKLPTLRNPAME